MYKQSLIVGLGVLIIGSVCSPVSFAAPTRLKEARDQLKEEMIKSQTLTESKESIDKKVRTLEKELEFLQNEISSSEAELAATIGQIEGVQAELKHTRDYIAELERTIQAQKQLIKEYVNSLYVQPEVSLFEIVLSNDKLSEIVGSVEKTGVMQNSITESITLIEAKEKEILSEKQHLFDKEEELISLRQLQEDQNALLAANKTQKETLLAQTQGEQSQFEQLLQASLDNQKTILNTIRLLGGTMGEGQELSIEEAYLMASVNATRLGNKLRPEFLVGIMIVESGLGRNVGKFYYKDSLSGCAARPGNITKINTAREERAFESIVAKLGLDSQQPVSGCPFPHYIGTGGAMGPAQIMPSTWLAYEPKLTSMKGAIVNPWDTEDAMLAMGVVLLGKVGDQDISGNEAMERRAAMCYLGGCRHTFYADRVMNEARRVKDLLGL